MVLPPIDHECSLQKVVTDLADRLAKLEHENAQLKKTLFGARMLSDSYISPSHCSA